MFFLINYIYYIIRNVTKNRLLGESAEFFFLRVNSIFKDNFFLDPDPKHCRTLLINHRDQRWKPTGYMSRQMSGHISHFGFSSEVTDTDTYTLVRANQHEHRPCWDGWRVLGCPGGVLRVEVECVVLHHCRLERRHDLQKRQVLPCMIC